MDLGLQNGLSRSVQPFQVLPVLSLRSGFSAAGACCSHSCPSGSHWPCTGPFSSSLDGRSASPPSESCTQRCLCQLCSQEGSDGKIVQLAFGHIATNHYTTSCFFSLFPASFSSFSPLRTEQECERTFQLLPQSWNKNCLSDSRF